MNSKLILIFGLVAAFAVIGLHATSTTDKALNAAKKVASEYASDAVDRAKQAVHDYQHDDDSYLDKAKHMVRDAAGNIIGSGVKSTAKASMAAGAAKMAYNAAHNIKERVWDDDDDETDPEARNRNDRLRKACKSRSSSRTAAEECFKDAKEWNDIEGEVDASGPSVFSRVKNYVTGDKEDKKEEKKGWL